MNEKVIDFRSDTVTQPTTGMRAAMAAAVVGDDIMGEDPTVRQLEGLGAARFGKDAGLFVISGTMANQIAVMAMTQLGDEILVGADSHLFNLEAGGIAGLSGVQARPISAVAGQMEAGEVRRAIRPRGLQSAVSRVLCLENTYDLNRGIPLGHSYIEAMADIAHAHEMLAYLDGARIFNAAVSQGIPVAELCAPVDALQCCLSKGLAAPVGALLLGSRTFIERARWVRQRLGGGMRQAGHMAAAGIVALETMSERLVEDHANARRLVAGLLDIDDRLVDPDLAITNIVHVDFGAAGVSATPVVQALLDRQIKIRQIDATRCRLVTHWGIEPEDIETTLTALKAVLRVHLR